MYLVVREGYSLFYFDHLRGGVRLERTVGAINVEAIGVFHILVIISPFEELGG